MGENLLQVKNEIMNAINYKKKRINEKKKWVKKFLRSFFSLFIYINNKKNFFL